MTTFERLVLSFMSVGALLSALILAVAVNTGMVVKGFIADLSVTDTDTASIIVDVSAKES